MKKKAVIIDIDGTMANIDHRIYLFEDFNEKDYDKFNELAKKDKPNEWCKLLNELLSEQMDTIFLTGRQNKYRKDTEKWLKNNGIDYDLLLMREMGDNRQDAIIKEEIYRKRVEPNYEILFVIEDRKRCVDMWRKIGLTALQCAKGEY